MTYIIASFKVVNRTKSAQPRFVLPVFVKMSSNNFSWLCCNKSPEKRTKLETVLPPGYKYKISSFKVLHESDVQNESKFEAVLTVNICQEEGIKQFITEFEKSSSTSYNQLHGDKKGGNKLGLSCAKLMLSLTS